MSKREPLTTEIELALAGTVVAGGTALVATVRADVPLDSWGDARAKAIMTAACSAADAGRDINTVTVAAALERAGALTMVGGIDGLDAIATRARPQDLPSMVERVQAHSRVRTVAVRVAELAREGHSPEAIANPDAYLADVAAVSDAARAQLKRGTVTAAQAVYATLQEFQQRGKVRPAVPTTILPLNDLMDGGWWPANVYVDGARPGVGKTALLVTEATHAASAGHPQLIWNSEIKVTDLTGRAIVQLAGIDGKQWRRGPVGMTESEGRSIIGAAKRFAMLPIHMECETLEIGSVLARSRVWIDTEVEPRRAEDPSVIPIVWLDYIQNYHKAGKWRTRDEMIGAMASDCVQFAKRHNAVVHLLAACNRQSAKDNRPPRFSDLRECGQLEFHASGVLLLHRESGADVESDPDAGELVQQDGLMIQDKCRIGRPGVVRATWDGPKGIWSERKSTWSGGGQHARH